MAWVDNRAWSHPKIVNLSDRAFRVWVNGICYSAGFFTKGVLSAPQQKVIGSKPAIRKELEDAGLWIDEGPSVLIHDWEDHNGARDRKERERREKDAQRKRDERERARLAALGSPDCPVDSGADCPADVTVDKTSLTVDRVTGDGSKEQDQNLLQRPESVFGLVTAVSDGMGRSF